MKSAEYRRMIKLISSKAIKQHFPGLKEREVIGASVLIARNVHALLYGANVDKVDSPLWRDDPNYIFSQPNVEANELLKVEP